jgi:hypothetical protein
MAVGRPVPPRAISSPPAQGPGPPLIRGRAVAQDSTGPIGRADPGRRNPPERGPQMRSSAADSLRRTNTASNGNEDQGAAAIAPGNGGRPGTPPPASRRVLDGASRSERHSGYPTVQNPRPIQHIHRRGGSAGSIPVGRRSAPRLTPHPPARKPRKAIRGPSAPGRAGPQVWQQHRTRADARTTPSNRRANRA